MRKFATAFLCLCLILCALVPANAAERKPLVVAQVPLIVSSNCWQVPAQGVQDDLARQIDRALHVPLNGILQAVTYLPEQDCTQALTDAYAQLGRRAHLRQVVQQMGTALQADLVVVPVLDGYEQYMRHSWHWERGLILHSYAAVTLGVYDRHTGQAFVKTASRLFDDEYTTLGEVETLARECMTQALTEADLHTRVMAAVKTDQN